jgi:hypothetical protein
MDPIQSQLSPVHILKPYLAKTHQVFPQFESKKFTPKQMAGEITVLCLNLFTFRQQTGGQTNLNGMINFPRIEAALNLFVTVIFISYCRPQSELCISEG